MLHNLQELSFVAPKTNSISNLYGVSDSVQASFDESSKYFSTPLQMFQYYDKYARYDYAKGRRETWIETVDRSVDFLRELSGNKLPEHTYKRIRSFILNMKAMPSMRLLAMAGDAARRSNIALYNCSFVPVDALDSFVEALIISMNGCGVGFSVESRHVNKLPVILAQTGEKLQTHVVADSSEGWSDALRLALKTWFSGKDIEFDYSLIRPQGAVLKIKGGRASGPEPLKLMLDFAKKIILEKQGSQLSTVDCLDMMCMVGNAAVSGGTRRTAMIALGDFNDEAIRSAKTGDFETEHWYRWNANISLVWPDRVLSRDEVAQFMTDMHNSHRGEPGIFSRRAGLLSMPSWRKPHPDFGTNPCLTEDSWVLTSDGPQQIKDLVGVEFYAMVNGTPYPSTGEGFWKTGRKQVFELKTKEGYSVKLTGNHKVLKVAYSSRKIEKTEWVEASDLKIGDKIKIHNQNEMGWKGNGSYEEGWLLGSLFGDGTFDEKNAILEYWGDSKEVMLDRAKQFIAQTVYFRSDMKGYVDAEKDFALVNNRDLMRLANDYGFGRNNKNISHEIEKASSAFYKGFLCGLFDADGTVGGDLVKGASVRLAQSNADTLHAVQRMLARLGIKSTVYLNRRPERKTMLPDGHGGMKEFDCKADHELMISNSNIQTFASTIGFSEPKKIQRLEEIIDSYQRKPNRERWYATVESFTPCGEEDVYDCSIYKAHSFDANGIHVHNCGEIFLRPYEFCNLSVGVARYEDTLETLMEKVEIATIIGTIQSMATHFPGLRPMWKENGEEERLVGVDLTGQLDSPAVQNEYNMEILKEHAIQTNVKYAKLLGINRAASVTCVKPSGNSSVLLNVSSGIHARWAKYYIRRVRVAASSPIRKVLADAGVQMSPENGQTYRNATTWVVSFPMKAPEGTTTRNDQTALSQLEYWLKVKRHWTTHNPSITVTYKDHELDDIIDWLFENQDYAGGLTFLPHSDAHFDQMPNEEISEEQYNSMIANFPEIDFSRITLYEAEDNTTAAQEVACSSGLCEMVL